MHKATPIIIKAALKQAGMVYSQAESSVSLFYATTASGSYFWTSPWSLYPIVRHVDSSVFKYKELTHTFLKTINIDSVKTSYLYNSYTNNALYEKLSEMIDQNISYPCVIKPNNSSGSKDVHIINSQIELETSIGLISSIEHICIQPYIKADEYRLFIVDGIIKFIYKKHFVSADNTERSEHVLDSSFTPLFNTAPDYLQSWAYTLYKKTSARVIGADVFLHESFGSEQKVIVLELNHNPGLGILYEYGYKQEIINILSWIYLES